MAAYDNIFRTLVTIVGENRATPAFEAVSRDAQRLQRDIQRVENATGQLVNTIINSITAGSGVKLMQEMVDRAEEYGQAVGQAERLVKNLGSRTNMVSGEIAESADRWSRSLLTPQTQIAKAQELWVRMGVTSRQQIEQLIPLTADFAATAGASFEEAGVAMGRALLNPAGAIGALRRAMINLSPEQEKMMATYARFNDRVGAFNFMMRILQERINGASEEQRKWRGETMALSMWTERLFINIGTHLMPSINATTGRMAKFVELLADATPEVMRFQAAVLALGTAVASVMAIRGAGALAVLMGTPAGAARFLSNVGVAVAAVTGLTLAFQALGKNTEERQKSLNKIVERFRDLSGIELPKLGDWLRELEEGFAKIAASPQWKALTEAATGVGTAFLNLLKTVNVELSKSFESTWIDTALQGLRDLTDALNGVRSAIEWFQKLTKSPFEAIGDLFKGGAGFSWQAPPGIVDLPQHLWWSAKKAVGINAEKPTTTMDALPDWLKFSPLGMGAQQVPDWLTASPVASALRTAPDDALLRSKPSDFTDRSRTIESPLLGRGSQSIDSPLRRMLEGDRTIDSPLRRMIWGDEAPARQHGGNIAPKGMAWVGERGAELIRLPQGGSVLPTRTSFQQASRYVEPFGGINDATERLTKNFDKLSDQIERLLKIFEKAFEPIGGSTLQRASLDSFGGTSLGSFGGGWGPSTPMTTAHVQRALQGFSGPTFRTGQGPGAGMTAPTQALGATGAAAAARGVRNNNPGNLKFGPYAQRMGATGADNGGFAIFPNVATGEKALEELLQRPSYAGKSIADIGARYAPGQPAWVENVSKGMGMAPGDVPNTADPAVRRRMVDAIRTAEGNTGSPVNAQGAPISGAVLAQAEAIAKTGNVGAVKQFINSQGYNVSSAYCGEFVSSIVKASGGTPPKGSPIASNWLRYGEKVDPKDARPGDIAVSRVHTYGRFKGSPIAPGQTGGHVGVVGSQGVNAAAGQFHFVAGNRLESTPGHRIGAYEFRRPVQPPQVQPPNIQQSDAAWAGAPAAQQNVPPPMPTDIWSGGRSRGVDMERMRGAYGDWRDNISSEIGDVMRERQAVELQGRGQIDVNLRGGAGQVESVRSADEGHLQLNLGRPTRFDVIRPGDPGVPGQS